MKRPRKQPSDLNQLAASIMRKFTGQSSSKPAKKRKAKAKRSRR